MTKRIEGHDVIAPGFTKEAIDDTLKLSAEINKLIGQFRDLFSLSAQMAQSGGTANVSGINAITQSYNQASAASESYHRVITKGLEIEQRLFGQIVGLTNSTKQTKEEYVAWWKQKLREKTDNEIAENKRLKENQISYIAWWKKSLQDLAEHEKHQNDQRAKSRRDLLEQEREAVREEERMHNQRKRDLEAAFDNSPYKKAIRHLNELKAVIKDLVVAGKENTAMFRELQREHNNLEAVIRRSEQAVGQFQRNVGNYASGQKKYNYELFQLTQVLREIPNAAISPRIFIMSLSNNLAQLGDAFKRVREDGNSFSKTLGIFARSVVSWQSVLLIAITAAIAFADEIGNLFTKQEKLSELEQKRVDQIKQLNKEVDQLNKGYISEKIALEQLVAIASDENETKANRQKAIQAINDISPEYLGNLTEENITTQEGIALVNQYIALLEKRARVAGLMKRLENVEMRKYDLQQAEYAIKDMDTDRLKEILGEDQFERLSDLATFNGTLDLMSKNAIPAFQKLAREQIGKMYRIAEMEAISLLESIEGIDPAARIPSSGSGKAKKEQNAKELKDTYIKDLMSRLETQYQIEVNEEQKIHAMKMKAAKDNNLRLALEEKRHLKEMTDLKMRALKAEIDIMEARMPKLTQEERDQLSAMKTNYDALAAQFARDAFVLFDSGLKSTDSDKPSGSNVIGKRGPTSQDSDKPKNKAKEMTRDLMDLAKAISDVMTKMEQAQQKQLDRQIDATKRKQETLRLLAAQGVKDAKDNLAFEEKEQAKLEQKQRQIERAALRRQAALAAMNTYAAKVQRGDTNALGGTISDLTALFAFASSIPGFHEGIENVSESDAIATRNTTVDPFLAWLHPQERVLTAAENKMVGTMSNKELATLAYNYQNGLYVTSTTDATLNEMREIKNAIKNMQAPSWSWNDIEKAIEYKFQQGDKTIREIHKTGGVWGGRH